MKKKFLFCLALAALAVVPIAKDIPNNNVSDKRLISNVSQAIIGRKSDRVEHRDRYDNALGLDNGTGNDYHTYMTHISNYADVFTKGNKTSKDYHIHFEDAYLCWTAPSLDMKDCYSFSLYHRGNIKIDLSNVPSGFNYKLTLYKFKTNTLAAFSNEPFSKEEFELLDTSYSTCTATEMLPGNYAVVVEREDKNRSSKQPYTLDIDVNSKIDEYYSKDLDLNEVIYTKNAIGAVWKSDYDAFGKSSIFYDETSGKIGIRALDLKEQTYDAKYTVEFNRQLGVEGSIAADKKYNDMSIYLWDEEAIDVLYCYLSSVLETLEIKRESDIDKLNNDYDSQKKLNFWLLDVPGLIEKITSLTKNKYAEIAGKCISVIGKTIFYFANSTLQEDIDNLKDDIHALSEMIMRYFILKRDIENTRLENSGQDRRVLKLDTYFSLALNKNPKPFNVYGTVTYSTDTYITKVDNKDGKFIKVINDKSVLGEGTIYPLLSDISFGDQLYEIAQDSRNELIDKREYDLNVKRIRCNETYSEEKLYGGEISYFRFAAPKDGTYTFAVRKTNGSSDVDGNYTIKSTVSSYLYAGRYESSSDTLHRDYSDPYDLDPVYTSVKTMRKGEVAYIRLHVDGWDLPNFNDYLVASIRINLEGYDAQFDNPNAFDYSFKGNELLFSCAYPAKETSRTDYLSNNELTVKSKRLRCGVVKGVNNNTKEEQNYLALSAATDKSGQTNLAYLDMNFAYNFDSLSFDIGRWSANEKMSDATNVEIYLHTTRGDFLYDTIPFNDEMLGNDKDNLKTITIKNKYNATGIMFKIAGIPSSKISGNKGRIVLDNFNFYSK